ncbi:MAG: ABC-three component system middle component 8 [Bacteroidales bacterium]
MIAPNKHTDIKTSVPYIAGLTLKEVTNSGIIKYDELKRSITNKVGKNLGDSFEYAVSFLFLLNKIVYNQSSDSFTLTL